MFHPFEFDFHNQVIDKQMKPAIKVHFSFMAPRGSNKFNPLSLGLPRRHFPKSISKANSRETTHIRTPRSTINTLPLLLSYIKF